MKEQWVASEIEAAVKGKPVNTYVSHASMQMASGQLLPLPFFDALPRGKWDGGAKAPSRAGRRAI
jgi:hypothetical protein